MVAGRGRKSRPGDGSAIRPLRRWDSIWRGRFGTDHRGVRYDIDVNFFDLDERVYLYRDGAQWRWQRSPAQFSLGDETFIEAELSTYGMKRVRLTFPGGTQQLQPIPGTAEAWRMRLHQQHRGWSRLLGALSWSILVVSLLLELPQLLEAVAEGTGWFTFTSPIALPSGVNIALTLAGVAAGLERALRLQHHWLLDE